MKLYGIKNCDTVKKARKQLEAEGAEYCFIDLKVTELDDQLVTDWLKLLPTALVNKRSTTYREIKQQWLDAEDNVTEQVALIKANPTVLKRPIVVKDNGEVTVGWSK